MASIAHVEGLTAKMAAHMQSLPSYDKQLHVIYLANDVLLKRSGSLSSCAVTGCIVVANVSADPDSNSRSTTL